jgi:hypothetical protein
VSFSDRNEAMGEDFLQSGTIMQEDGSYFQGHAGEYIVHPDDILHVHLTSDVTRVNGCCGLDGCDGPNLQCVCGTYVATKRTDCWHSHCVVFEAKTTQAVDGA